MTNSIALVGATAKVIVGVETHKHVHVAVAISLLGARLGTISVAADRAACAELVEWARVSVLSSVRDRGHALLRGRSGELRAPPSTQGCRGNHCDRGKRRNNARATPWTPSPLPCRCCLSRDRCPPDC